MEDLTSREIITAKLTIKSIDWEVLTGRNVGEKLPDVVENMSVEELLQAINKKLDNR